MCIHPCMHAYVCDRQQLCDDFFVTIHNYTLLSRLLSMVYTSYLKFLSKSMLYAYSFNPQPPVNSIVCLLNTNARKLALYTCLCINCQNMMAGLLWITLRIASFLFRQLISQRLSHHSEWYSREPEQRIGGG